jgi:Ni,Fe-hydrogenase III small subunit/NAD-dependent dihydropyrimidine dehydrogenase PreA subunit
VIGWLWRGLASRRLTTSYPRRPEPAPDGFRGRAVLAGRPSATDAAAAAAVCLPGALEADGDTLILDTARCIGCGLCVRAISNGALRIESRFELAASDRESLTATSTDHAPAAAANGARRVPRPFRRSIHIRHLDTGSDGAVEQEIAALLNPYYDMQRLGLFFTATPRHADVLLVTGPVTAAMEDYLRRTYEAMPEPRLVVAAGTDACSGGIWTEPETRGGVDRVLPVDVYVPGDPPSPIALLHGLLLATGRVKSAEPPVAEEAAAG